MEELEERLAACAAQAERSGNARFFQDRSPTKAECGVVVEQDPCGKPITLAMRLGQQKHVLALQCAEEVLKDLWPAPFSIEQRYRYYPNARIVETISREKEGRLIAQDCTEELRGTWCRRAAAWAVLPGSQPPVHGRRTPSALPR